MPYVPVGKLVHKEDWEQAISRVSKGGVLYITWDASS